MALQFRPGTSAPSGSVRQVLVPLALAQFICSFAGSNMNVMITSISQDLHTTVRGVQTAITLFLLVMAALMIPGGKLTDRLGRKRCFLAGLALYGCGAVLSAVAPGIGVLVLGYSVFEGVGTALLIPPVYILATILFPDVTARARAFGTITGMGAVGAAAGPLIGGLIATGIDWRAAFAFQALIVAGILLLGRRVEDPVAADPSLSFDVMGALLSAAGLVALVLGIVQAASNLVFTGVLICVGAGFIAWFFLHVSRLEREGGSPLLATSLFGKRAANLALATQNIQWLLLMGTAFVVSAFLQVIRGYNAIQTGVIFTAATAGVLASSIAAERLAKRFAQRSLVIAGFAVDLAGILVLLAMVKGSPSVWAFAPGLLLIGLGLGTMLTPSVNVVQSSFSEAQQGEISGLSRSVSNLGSSFGTAIGGTVLVVGLPSPERSYGVAMLVLGAIGLGGLVLSVLLPAEPPDVAAAPEAVVPGARRLR